jgi:signal transduction histidine kinase
MVEQGHKLEIGRTSMIGWCVANRMARIALDVGEEAVRFDNPLLPDTRSELALPLGSRGEIIGALTIQSTQAAAFSEEDIAVLQTMADQLANAIANVQLFDQAQRELAGRKRAEEALRQYAAELEARNEDLDAFAHTVAHDLQNPLSLIVGCAQVLDESYDSMPGEQIQSCVRTIARNGRRMSNIIDELLLLSGLRQVEVDLKPLDMASIVAEARQRLANMIDERDAQIVLPKTWPVVIGHGPWVEEVWANLLSNAIKYGGQSPCVELGAELQRGNMVSFWVRDNGPGLLPEEQSRLFTPFTRLDQVQTKGYGLGLSIVQRIVEKLGGQVGIESETGKGSTFWFTLRAL